MGRIPEQARGRDSMLPNFLIAGAAKAGSTTLYYYLAQHPDILMSSGKEPRFFTEHWDKGLAYYEQWFTAYAGEKAVGEASPDYLASQSAARIQQILPDVRFIFALRDPIARTRSHYWHSIGNGRESRSFDEMLAGGRDEWIIRSSLYYTNIKHFLNFFPLERMHFVITEDMAKDLSSCLRGVFEFLKIDLNVPIEDEGPKNTAKIRRSEAIRKALVGINRSGALRKFIPLRMRPYALQTYKFLRDKNYRPFTPPELRAEQVKFLSDIFTPEIEGLEQLLGCDLSIWKRYHCLS